MADTTTIPAAPIAAPPPAPAGTTVPAATAEIRARAALKATEDAVGINAHGRALLAQVKPNGALTQPALVELEKMAGDRTKGSFTPSVTMPVPE